LGSRRKLVQGLSALLSNGALPNFKTGAISRGPLKNVCVPGLNCYSCPGAVASCPLGALQNSLAEGRFPFYVAGLLLMFGVALGRGVCGFLCPFGLAQELLYKIPSPKLRKNVLTRRLSLIKYGMLLLPTVGLPLGAFLAYGYGAPFFCEFVCPAGALEAGVPLALAQAAVRNLIGGLYFWKIAVLAALGLLSVLAYRCFCRFLCPLGALYSLFNPLALWGLRRDTSLCTRCGACAEACTMDTRIANDRECIRCGNCVSLCPAHALSTRSFPATIRGAGVYAPRRRGNPQDEGRAPAKPSIEG
jgi:polyferredoxin